MGTVIDQAALGANVFPLVSYPVCTDLQKYQASGECEDCGVDTKASDDKTQCVADCDVRSILNDQGGCTLCGEYETKKDESTCELKTCVTI